MNDLAQAKEAQSVTYTTFIKQAFIDPIRTVSIVDDEYPTLDWFLGQEKTLLSRGWVKGQVDSTKALQNVENLLALIATCRDKAHNWLVDVYDGQPDSDSSEELRFPKHLHHSDLLVLDYHLNGEQEGKSELALGILRQLSEIEHFNLVVVHTKGYQSSVGSPEPIVEDIVTSLLRPPSFNKIPDHVLHSFEDDLDDWEDDKPGIRESIIESISVLDFLSMYRDFGHVNQKKECLESKYASDFRTIFESKPDHIDISINLLFWFALTQTFETLCDSFNENGVERVDWCVNGGINWIRTDKIFITVVGKDVEPSTIPDRLLKALSAWNPHPHSLLLAKLRHEIDEKAGPITEGIVGKSHVQAHWLGELLEAQPEALPTTAWTILEKHWNELALSTKDTLSEFALAVIGHLKKQNTVEEIKQTYNSSEAQKNENQVLAHANCFNCSTAVVGYHLTTGHILKLQQGGNPQYWLCLTPACDAIPGQKESKHLKNNLPIKLVQLFEAKAAFAQEGQSLSDDQALEEALKLANRNEMLFLKIDDKVQPFCFSSKPGKAHPKWQQFYALSNGVFRDGHKLRISRMVANEGGDLSIETLDTEVICQLRYEYALNLLQKLGATLSRIGLDFSSLKTPAEAS